jgi:hypothetical protein
MLTNCDIFVDNCCILERLQIAFQFVLKMLKGIDTVRVLGLSKPSSPFIPQATRFTQVARVIHSLPPVQQTRFIYSLNKKLSQRSIFVTNDLQLQRPAQRNTGNDSSIPPVLPKWSVAALSTLAATLLSLLMAYNADSIHAEEFEKVSKLIPHNIYTYKDKRRSHISLQSIHTRRGFTKGK